MKFIVPHRDRLPAAALDLAYLANHEESPSRTLATWQGDWLALDRDESESATLTIPWIVRDRPAMALSTGTLVERPRPYLLPVELARGMVYRLRTYTFAWHESGLVLPEQLPPLVRKAVQAFAQAATAQDRPPHAAELAEESLDAAIQASELLCAAYGAQSAAARREVTPRAPFLVGTTLDDRPPDRPFAELLLHACNTLSVPFTWRSVEANQGAPSWRLADAQIAWCQAHELRICGGPLVRLDQEALPDWVTRATQPEELLSRALRHVTSVIERYRGRVQLWNCAASVNTGPGVLSLTEEQRLRLAVRIIETVRAADQQTPIILTLDQPWGEYLRDERHQLSPIHFADALARGDLGLSGFGLRINVGLDRDATLPRSVLGISRQIDRWSMFNMPLLIEFTLPPDSSPDIDTQKAWIDMVVPVLLGKPAVQAIFWGRLSDGDGPAFADRGLFDREGPPKPALQAFSAIRRIAE